MVGERCGCLILGIWFLTARCLQVNKPGRIIILYDDNERTAPRAATIFVQKGVDNVFMLSGGNDNVHLYN